MGICFNLSLVMLSERACTRFHIDPSLFFTADLALITFATKANHMATFVRSYLLSPDLFVTNPTTKLFPHLLHY